MKTPAVDIKSNEVNSQTGKLKQGYIACLTCVFHTVHQVTGQYVEKKAKQFKKRFKELKRESLENLNKRGISVDTITDTLRSLSALADESDEHKIFTDSHMNVLEQANNNSVLIGHLDFHMDYLSYHLLDYLVVKFNLEEVKEMMEAYKSDLQKFRVKVPLTQFCKARNKISVKLSSEFKVVVAEFDHSTELKLEDMENFQLKFVSSHNLRHCSMVLAGIDCHNTSIHCSWLIPQSVAENLKKALPFENHSLLRLSVGGACVYSHRQVF